MSFDAPHVYDNAVYFLIGPDLREIIEQVALIVSEKSPDGDISRTRISFSFNGV